MRRAPLFLALLAAPSLFALEFSPPMVDSHTGVSITFQSACVPEGHAAISGNTIKLTATQRPGFGCIAEAPPAVAVAKLPPLPPGVYDVQAPQERATLIVRDADSEITVSPVAMSTSGGRIVQVFSDRPFDQAVSVTFDGVPAAVELRQLVTSEEFLVVTPPAHAAGTVDVSVTDNLGTRNAVAAFTYFDPAAPVDPQLFEPVLYPVAYSGPGVFGSQWRTENEIGTGDTAVRFKDLQQVEACEGACGALNWSGLLSRQSQSGMLVWVARRRLPPGSGFSDEFRAASRIIELSRPDSVNTTLPVARERDFRRDFTIGHIPLGPDARVTLRLYAPVQRPVVAYVTLDRAGTVTTQPVVLTPVNSVAFAALDVAPSATGARTQPLTVRVSSGDRVWALVTLTDNGTQQITAFWPQ